MRVGHAPMLYLLLPLMVGIIAANWLPAQIIPILILTILSLITMAIWERAKYLIYLVIAGVGYIIASLNAPTSQLEDQHNIIITLESGQSGQAVVTSHILPSGERDISTHKVLLWGADSLDFKSLTIRGNIKTIDSEQDNDYYAAMHRKGFEARVSIVKILASEELEHLPLSVKMNRWAMARLRSLELRDEAFALAAAIGLARRDELDKQTIESYNRSGVSHLLALSGLHIGIVALLISALTYFIPLMRYGHIVADIVAIVAIWLFATMVGLGESVMRAAWMFTLLKLASIISRRYNSLNALFTAAVMVLCFDPSALYDLGFTLSFTAVAAIIILGVPIVRFISTGNYLVDLVISSMVIGSVATIATAPLISNSFGYIVLLSPVTTLPLLLTTFVIILATTLWVVMPITLLSPLFYWAIEVSTTVQNYMVEWFASWNFGLFEYRMSNYEVAFCYTALLIITLLTTRLIERGYQRKRSNIFLRQEELELD